MSVASQVFRIIIFPIILITVGTIAVFGFIVIEPFFSALGEPPAGLGWGSPALKTMTFASFGFLGLILVLVIWFWYAPIREDRRQQYRY